MKYLIFGTGGAARKFMRVWYNVYFEYASNSILAFVDNNTQKVGSTFLDKLVISPLEISQYEYDYIVICSVFEAEIREQLIADIKCKPDRILSVSEAREIIYNYFDMELNLRTKKVIEINSSERVQKLHNGENQWQVYFDKAPDSITIDQLSSIDISNYDYVFISEAYGFEDFFIENQPILSEKNLIMHLSKTLGISQDRILTLFLKELLMYHTDGAEQSLGEENKDKTFYVIRLSSLWSIMLWVEVVATVSEYAKSKGYIPVVDGFTIPTMYHEEGEIGKINVWEKFFEQPAAWKLEDIQQSKHVIQSGRYVQSVSNQAFKNIIMKPKLKAAVDNFNLQLKKYRKVLGVHYRGTDYNNARWSHHAIQPTAEEMIAVVDEKIYEWNKADGEKFDAIFLCTEDENAVLAFQQHFGDMLLSLEQERWSSDCQFVVLQADQFESKYDMGSNYWIDIITLSKCHSLISCECIGQRVAEKFNDACYENMLPYVHIHHVCKGYQGMLD